MLSKLELTVGAEKGKIVEGHCPIQLIIKKGLEAGDWTVSRMLQGGDIEERLAEENGALENGVLSSRGELIVTERYCFDLFLIGHEM